MLGASKLQILAGLKLAGTDLRSRELDFYMERYITLGGVSSIMCSLTYVGLIKIAIPEYKQVSSEVPGNELGSAEVACFYVFTACAMCLGMFNLFITGVLVVQAQGLALRGPPGSLAKAVDICRDHWPLCRLLFAVSLCCLMGAAVSIIWMKDSWLECRPLEEAIDEETTNATKCKEISDDADCYDSYGAGEARDVFWDCDPSLHIISACLSTVIFVVVMGSMVKQLISMLKMLRVPPPELVGGDLRVSPYSGRESVRVDIVAEQEMTITLSPEKRAENRRNIKVGSPPSHRGKAKRFVEAASAALNRLA
uniref:Uncharacterized protein n=1 Tax=Haptolina ericina TaxID=156174 RepID=A0A7S3B686_9EUKA|mmetsp:Transcript_52228/g.117319  ORF Transcript_52228/g.117319 Transcript_52228/m.117319 type:complete len:310 (+) Transcript_52228:97-1026(+)